MGITCCFCRETCLTSGAFPALLGRVLLLLCPAGAGGSYCSNISFKRMRMELETIYSLVIFLLVVIGFVTRKIPMGVVSMGGFILMVIFGILDSDAAIGVFAKDTWIIIASLYIISASFTRTTYVNKMATWPENVMARPPRSCFAMS